MQQKTLLGLALVAVLAVGCSDNGNPASPTRTSETTPGSADANADGSTLKVHRPTLSAPPHDSQLTERQVTLTINNGQPKFASGVDMNYRFEMYREGQTGAGSHLFAQTVPQTGTATSVDAGNADTNVTYVWRARAEFGDARGPWSDWFKFTGPARPLLPFDVPAVCETGNGLACAMSLAVNSRWWALCVGGSGVNCHRFTRQVAAALAVSDPSWGLITKNPGEQQCTWDHCWSGDGSGYGEDVVAYHRGGGNWTGWDLVVGAGAPGASVGWSQLEGRRPGNNWAPVPPFP
jgi:hypothetical protein